MQTLVAVCIIRSEDAVLLATGIQELQGDIGHIDWIVINYVFLPVICLNNVHLCSGFRFNNSYPSGFS